MKIQTFVQEGNFKFVELSRCFMAFSFIELWIPKICLSEATEFIQDLWISYFVKVVFSFFFLHAAYSFTAEIFPVTNNCFSACIFFSHEDSFLFFQRPKNMYI